MGDFLDKTGLTRVKAKIDSALAAKLNVSLKGVANGVAELNENGHVPSSQLPSYVDDVVEYLGIENFPTNGEIDKIYLDTVTNKIYRWSGSRYVEVSESLALGETSGTAYRGDRGKAAYDHALANGAEYSTGLYKIKTNAEGHVTYAAPVTKSDITDLGIPGSDTNTTYSFADKNATLAWGTTHTIATVGGVNIRLTMPANPNTNTTYAFSNKAVTLAWNTTHTIATVGGVNITLKMPANPNTNTTYAFTNKGVTLAWNTTHTIATVGGVNITLKMPANPVSIVNNLTSTVTTSALSAAQGKVLNGKFAATEDAWTGQGIFKNAIAILSKRYTSLGMAFIMGNVNVGRVQSSSGYSTGTQYTIAYCASLKNSDVYGLGAFAANGDADVKVMFDHGYIKFATINNKFPDIIWFSGCIPV